MNVSDLKKLPQLFYDRNTIDVAKDLLGKYLVRVIDGIHYVGKIVEVEAYLGPHDLAAHSSKGLTKRTQALFGPAGHAYIYLIYGMYHCFNTVTEGEGTGSGVLIRAVEPILNIAGRTQGPGLVCKAMQIDLNLYGHPLESDNLFIASHSDNFPIKIIKAPRVGVDYAGAWAKKLLRFYIHKNKFVSRYK